MSNKFFGESLTKIITKLGLIFILSIIFGFIYFKYFNSSHHWFILQKTTKNEITFTNMVCYSIMNFTTLGLGDLLPKSYETRIMTSFQALITYLIILY